MRGINLLPLPRPPSDVDGCWKLYTSRIEHGALPAPEASLCLAAYMAWPNDEAERNSWMAITSAFFIEKQAEIEAHTGSQVTTFEMFGGLRAVADAAFSHAMGKLSAIQQRWSRVADILQAVVDVKHETRRSIPGGASISKAFDLLKGDVALPRKSRLSKDWSDFRDVAHLIAAAAHIAFTYQERTAKENASAVFTPVLLVPEVVLAFGIAYQQFGLSFKPHGRRNPILSPQTLWRIPYVEGAAILPLPIRRLSDADLDYLTHKRRAAKRGPPPKS